MRYDYIIVSHAGAGSHSKYKEEIYKTACKKSCKAALSVLNKDKAEFPDLVKAAVEAIKVLEDDPCTNAGVGSNLTINGRIQCDASIMCGQSLRFGAVGAVSNVKNPILVAQKILQHQIDEPLMTGGRYPPSVLVGSDAMVFAREHGIEMAKNEELITVERLKKYEKYKNCLPIHHSNVTKRKVSNDTVKIIKRIKSISGDTLEEVDDVSDTVGVIIADSLGRVVSATSSGGIFLKQEGRLGQSCMFGCGCYSEQKDDGVSVTSVSTGLGEQLMRTMLPYKTCEAVASWSLEDAHNDLPTQFKSFVSKQFMNSPFLNGDVYKAFGVLALRSTQIDDKISMDFLFGHSTASMCFGYLSSRDKVAQATMSRKPDENTEFVVGCMGEYFTR